MLTNSSFCILHSQLKDVLPPAAGLDRLDGLSLRIGPCNYQFSIFNYQLSNVLPPAAGFLGFMGFWDLEKYRC